MKKLIIFIMSIICLSAANGSVRDVRLTLPGTLGDALGNDMLTSDSLIVEGPVNDADFKTMWQASFDGQLCFIDLSEADIADRKVPDNAFFNRQTQKIGYKQYKPVKLRKIILPEGVEYIGNEAFCYAANLEEINLPQSLNSLGFACFENCSGLKVSPLVIPQGVTEIPNSCFLGCSSLDKVELPSSITKIGLYAFMDTSVSDINFPENLESVEEHAFYNTRLVKVELPDGCLVFNDAFSNCLELTSISFPTGMESMPMRILQFDANLVKVKIPSTVENISYQALADLHSLKEIDLPDALNSIYLMGLYNCSSLEKLVLPSSLTELGEESCANLRSLKALYCKALVPPRCIIDSDNYNHVHAFGKIMGEVDANSTPRDIPVYVPVGTAQIYRHAQGWNYFNNYIETDEFPTSGVEAIELDNAADSKTVYDLMGRPVDEITPGRVYISNGKKEVYGK